MDDAYITESTYLRFEFTPDFVTHPFLIYLDADMLVLGDIEEPLNSLTNGTLGAVRDQFNHTIGECPALPGFSEDFSLHDGKPYFNAGALWMEAGLMQKIKPGVHSVAVRAKKYIKHNDQDALNLWLLAGAPVTSVSRLYNHFELSRFLEASDWVRRVVTDLKPPEEATLLHFVGPMKPWQPSCPRTAAVRDYQMFQRETSTLLRQLGIPT